MEVPVPTPYFFLHAESGESWPVTEPVSWLLAHADEPVLGRARERLLTLGPEDGDRVVRLVTRRCGLALVHVVREAHVVVHYWSAMPDLRPIFRQHRLARPGVRAMLWNRKNDVVTVFESAEAFMFGGPVEATFPWWQFEEKWRRRHILEADDWQVAPHTLGTLCWEQASTERTIPWTVLKSLWQHDQAPACPNCDTPLLALRFLWVLPIMFSGIRKITRGCFRCHREFEEWVDDFWAWLVTHLDPDLLPDHQYGTKKLDLRSRHPTLPDRG